MRDIVSCVSENSINVTKPSCSSAANNCVSPLLLHQQQAAPQTAVTSIYKISLKNTFTLSLRWSPQSLSVTLTTATSSPDSFKLNLNSRRNKKGFKSFPGNADLSWDLTAAKFDPGPEPSGSFSIVATFDSEVGLSLGSEGHVAGPARLVSRREHCSGSTTVYATRARFSDNGTWHDVTVNCSDSLSVAIDSKTVVRVKRLRWNFRGNQTIFLDGLLVDLLWDLHDWFFNPRGSFRNFAVFMFRTRSSMDSRLWLEENLFNNTIQQDTHDQFSLFIYACKTSQ